MSAVINKAKSHYRKALKIELWLILGLGLILAILKKEWSVSFSAGSFSSFVPHCVFTFWVFFRNSAKDRTKMTAFYLGEVLKWLVAIFFIVISFLFIQPLHYAVFFIGYILALLLNILLPILLSQKST